ncbi:Domain of uncharacterised function, DUF446 [Escherichia coli]|nr:Domain of uncharacterised function, DUF446 [Escherichia coli]
MTAFVSSCRRLKHYCVNISTGKNDEPQPHQFNSTQPFFMDTMEPLEWLQWVLIPRMHDLLDNNQPLPGAFAVAPYYEMALATDHPQRALILAELEKLDALFADDAS